LGLLVAAGCGSAPSIRLPRPDPSAVHFVWCPERSDYPSLERLQIETTSGQTLDVFWDEPPPRSVLAGSLDLVADQALGRLALSLLPSPDGIFAHLPDYRVRASATLNVECAGECVVELWAPFDPHADEQVGMASFTRSAWESRVPCAR
jgi:hypothetical protein